MPVENPDPLQVKLTRLETLCRAVGEVHPSFLTDARGIQIRENLSLMLLRLTEEIVNSEDGMLLTD